MKITDIAKSINIDCEMKQVGIRPGEKLHEQMISEEDSHYTYEYAKHFKILPVINDWAKSKERIKNGKKVPDSFTYRSDNNSDWMSKEQLKLWLINNIEDDG